MSCFVDASVIVAILGRETDWEEQSDRLDAENALLWSPVSCWEATVALRSRLDSSLAEARSLIAEFAQDNRFRLVPIGASEVEIALDAFERYGKGAGHPARLNMGDCFAYACATANAAKLLYKGDDFSKTDLA